jgi:hypothetical protein
MRRIIVNSCAQPTARPTRAALSFGVTTNFAYNNYSTELQQSLVVAPENILHFRSRFSRYSVYAHRRARAENTSPCSQLVHCILRARAKFVKNQLLKRHSYRQSLGRTRKQPRGLTRRRFYRRLLNKTIKNLAQTAQCELRTAKRRFPTGTREYKKVSAQ